MKKFLRFIGILLLVLVLIVIILGLIEPKEVTVERSIVINGPREVVWDQMVKFKNSPNWDPWMAADPSAVRTYFGTDGQPGSGYSWVGKKLGEGNMTDTGIDGNKMKYWLHFEKPWFMKSDASGFYKVEDAGNGQTKVTWNYYQHMDFPKNASQVIMSPEKMLGNMFDSGLNNLKKYVESGKAGTGSAGTVKEVEFPTHNYAGIRKTVTMADMMKFFEEATATLNTNLGGIIGPEATLYYTWDTVKHTTDMAVVYPIADSIKSAKGVSIFHINAAKADMIVHKGGYGTLSSSHMAVNKYMAEKGHQMGLSIEEYTVSKKQEPDSNKWVTNIYYITK